MINNNTILSILASENLSAYQYSSVSGGDINQAFCLFKNNQKYFLKINYASLYPGMFIAEAEGLNALHKSGFRIPEVINIGEMNGCQYLLLEWIETGSPSPDFWNSFGQSLAELHLITNNQFGFCTNNYIGSLTQLNTLTNSWEDFYGQYRIMPLVRILLNEKKFDHADVEHAELFCKKINEIFPDEPPALLHGDLWSGNYKVDDQGNLALYDPAVYFGHREMDIGMTKLFGGFSSQMYERYNEIYPLEKNWIKRLPYTQLYPLLVHAVLFGGHYITDCIEIIERF